MRTALGIFYYFPLIQNRNFLSGSATQNWDVSKRFKVCILISSSKSYLHFAPLFDGGKKTSNMFYDGEKIKVETQFDLD